MAIKLSNQKIKVNVIFNIKMKKLKVLVACEESQAVTKEFRRLGHEAYSCDILPCSGGHPEWHLQASVDKVNLDNWDLIVAFPPCTFLSNAGACRLYPKKGELNIERYNKGLLGKEFFMKFYNCKTKYVAIENPVQSKVFDMPKYNQIIQPYEYGHPYSKKTCLWLKNLPNLIPDGRITAMDTVISWVSGGSKDHNGNPRKQSGTKHRDSVIRSKTFPGIAKAMAEQWSEYILKQS